MNPFKVAWRSYWQAEANWPRLTALATIIVGFVLIVGILLIARSYHDSNNMKITLSTMVKVGDGEWQKAECAVWVEGRSDDLDAKMWGVWVGDGHVTDSAAEVEPGSGR